MLPEKYEESEAPNADMIQGIFALVFFVVWGVDSFWLEWTTGILIAPNLIRNALFVGLLIIGTYFTWSSHQLIFGIERDEAELVDYGVFKYSRHPMYLGIMIMYLGLALSSMSLATLSLLVPIFLFYNYIASYEEGKLAEHFGDDYRYYMKRVRRWL